MAKALRYAGDPDSIRGKGIYVHANGASQADVLAGIQRFWIAGDAKEESPEPVESGAFKREGLVGFAVVPPSLDVDDEPWIGVRDSVHFSLGGWSEDLAHALSHYLGVPTFAFLVGPKTRLVSVGDSRYFGLPSAGLVARKSTKTREKTVVEVDRFPHPFFTYTDASGIDGVAWLRFRFGERTLHKLEFVKEFWKASGA